MKTILKTQDAPMEIMLEKHVSEDVSIDFEPKKQAKHRDRAFSLRKKETKKLLRLFVDKGSMTTFLKTQFASVQTEFTPSFNKESTDMEVQTNQYDDIPIDFMTGFVPKVTVRLHQAPNSPEQLSPLQELKEEPSVKSVTGNSTTPKNENSPESSKKRMLATNSTLFVPLGKKVAQAEKRRVLNRSQTMIRPQSIPKLVTRKSPAKPAAQVDDNAKWRALYRELSTHRIGLNICSLPSIRRKKKERKTKAKVAIDMSAAMQHKMFETQVVNTSIDRAVNIADDITENHINGSSFIV